MRSYTVNVADAGTKLSKYIKKLLPKAPGSFFYKMFRKKNIVLNGKKSSGDEILVQNDLVEIFVSESTFDLIGAAPHNNCLTQQAQPMRECPVTLSRDSSETPVAEHSLQQNTAYADSVSPLAYISRHVDGFCDSLPPVVKDTGSIAAKIKIFFENSHIAVVFKPAGIPTQKSAACDFSLNEYFRHNFGDLQEQSLFKPCCCNRLDINTEGPVIIAKSVCGAQTISKALREYKIHKHYQCILMGRLPMNTKIVSEFSKDSKTNTVTILHSKVYDKSGTDEDGSVFDSEKPHSNQMITSFKPVGYAFLQKDFPYWKNTGIPDGIPVSLCEAQLFTGKSHQIRAQAQALGYPIVGDRKYCGNKSNIFIYDKYRVKSQILRCVTLSFPHESLPEYEGLEKFSYCVSCAGYF